MTSKFELDRPIPSGVIKLRDKIADLLSRKEALDENGCLPNGGHVLDFVDHRGAVDIEGLAEVCGDEAVQGVVSFLTTRDCNPAWSKRTEQAQEKTADFGLFRGPRRPIRRGPGRHSDKVLK